MCACVVGLHVLIVGYRLHLWIYTRSWIIIPPLSVWARVGSVSTQQKETEDRESKSLIADKHLYRLTCRLQYASFCFIRPLSAKGISGRQETERVTCSDKFPHASPQLPPPNQADLHVLDRIGTVLPPSFLHQIRRLFCRVTLSTSNTAVIFWVLTKYSPCLSKILQVPEPQRCPIMQDFRRACKPTTHIPSIFVQGWAGSWWSRMSVPGWLWTPARDDVVVAFYSVV